MTWRMVGVSVEGAGHRRRGGGCQDAHRVLPTADGFVLAVADGAGSAPHGGDGAWLAVDTAVEALASVRTVGLAAAAVAMGLARSALEVEAQERGLSLGDLATTIHVAVLAGDRLTTAQIGDGAVVARDDGGAVAVVDAVERGEYLNETVFLTSSSWAEEARFGDHDGSALDAIAVLTDGLQLLAFDMAEGTPHAGFFDPMWRWASDVDPSAGEAELAEFLSSERVQSRTDDDTTLVLAVRD